jgi:hypothetical protein
VQINACPAENAGLGNRKKKAYLLRPEVPIRRILDIEYMHKQIQMAAFTLERKALHKPHIAIRESRFMIEISRRLQVVH